MRRVCKMPRFELTPYLSLEACRLDRSHWWWFWKSLFRQHRSEPPERFPREPPGMSAYPCACLAAMVDELNFALTGLRWLRFKSRVHCRTVPPPSLPPHPFSPPPAARWIVPSYTTRPSLSFSNLSFLVSTIPNFQIWRHVHWHPSCWDVS